MSFDGITRSKDLQGLQAGVAIEFGNAVAQHHEAEIAVKGVAR
jgi:hypothetical protein